MSLLTEFNREDVMNGHMVVMLAIGWGTVTLILAALLLYRSMLENHEEDQLFLDKAEESMATEQTAVVSRIERFTWPIRTLTALSVALLVATVAAWLWQGLGL